MKVLVVATHPDDEVLGCGGTVAWHVARGDEVSVLVVTRGIPDIFSESEIEQTRHELRMAHQVLGVTSTRFLDFPAPRLDTVPGHVLADAIRGVIYSFAADTVYVPHWGDLHTDHQAVVQSTLVAARPIGDCPVCRILCYETVSETEWCIPTGAYAFIPTVFVDISRFLEAKLKAASCYATQIKQSPHPRSLANLASLAAYRGASVGVQSAEAFVLTREIVR